LPLPPGFHLTLKTLFQATFQTLLVTVEREGTCTAIVIQTAGNQSQRIVGSERKTKRRRGNCPNEMFTVGHSRLFGLLALLYSAVT